MKTKRIVLDVGLSVGLSVCQNISLVYLVQDSILGPHAFQSPPKAEDKSLQISPLNRSHLGAPFGTGGARTAPQHGDLRDRSKEKKKKKQPASSRTGVGIFPGFAA